MAENAVNRKAAGPQARKISAPVHRTTTETIRLGDPSDSPGKIQSHHHHQHGQSLGSVPMPTSNSGLSPNAAGRTKKTSSFQITSVTVGCRMSNDTGEDSNDDLDESHTEDNSVEHSRVTDIETPSYSEDTFSKDDVFFNTSNAALSTAPVIPTSSQYGLAIVPSSEANNTSNVNNENNINTLDIASVTDNNIINLLSSNAKQDADLREVHSHGRNERFKVVKIESTEPFKRGRWTCMDYLDHTSVNQPAAMSTPKMPDPNEVCVSYGVTDAGVIISDAVKQQQQHVDDKSIAMDANGSMHPDIQQSYAQQQQVPAQYYQSSTSQSPPQQQQQTTAQQGATLPTNLQPTHPNNLGQTQSMPQGAIPILTQQGCPVTQANAIGTQQQTQQQSIAQHPKQDEASAYVNSQNVSMPQNSQASNILVTQQQPTSQPQQQIPESMGTMQGMQPPGMQSIHKVPPQSGATPQQQQQMQQPQSQVMQPGPSSQQQSQQQQTQQQQQATTGGPVQMVGGMQQQQGNMAFHQQTDQEQDSMTAGMVVTGAPPQPGQSLSTDTALLESLAEVTQTTDDHQAHEDNESMSGTSAVAIDNKIEQAMDLVKSHLMFAVREEVEVLKEKIAELMDRINQLEAENSILKAHATPETLAQLSQSATKMSMNNAGSGQ